MECGDCFKTFFRRRNDYYPLLQGINTESKNRKKPVQNEMKYDQQD